MWLAVYRGAIPIRLGCGLESVVDLCGDGGGWGLFSSFTVRTVRSTYRFILTTCIFYNHPWRVV
jgi:hypothetical protein